MADEPSTEIVTVDVVPSGAISLDDATTRFEEFIAFVKSQMVDGEDMGVIPGTQKPTLLKPGAEKLCNFFGFAIEQPPDLIQRLEDWDREPPRFAYEVHTILRSKRTGIVESTGLGACNSMESKYRWRKGGADCPGCGEMLRRSKNQPEWYCWQKMGGCGATFPLADFTEQRIENTETADQQNTILKMAAKRSMIDAVLKATRGSGLFTQDMEDASAPPAAVEQGAPSPEPMQSRLTPEQPANGSANVKAPPEKIENLGHLLQFASYYHGWQPEKVASFVGVDTIGDIASRLSEDEHTYQEVADAIKSHTENNPADEPVQAGGSA